MSILEYSHHFISIIKSNLVIPNLLGYNRLVFLTNNIKLFISLYILYSFKCYIFSVPRNFKNV